MRQGKRERVPLTVPHALKLHLFCLSTSEAFRHYLIATAGLVNLTRTRRLEDNEQFAFASQIELHQILGTKSRDDAPSGEAPSQ
jgi:hypothetical protein